MATKEEKYLKEMQKFLKSNYECDVYTFRKYDLNNNFNGKYETMADSFIIKTKNAGNVFIHPTLWTCDKPFKYNIFTQKFAYIQLGDGSWTFSKDERFKKNNFFAIPTIEEVKQIILSEYETTKE